jgi:hypothetical protein
MKRYCVLGGLGCFLAALLFAFWHLWLFRSESTTVQETPFLFKWRWGRPSHFCVDANGNGYYETWYRQESYGSFSTTASPDEALVDGDEDGVYELHAVWQPTPRVHFRIAIDEDGDGLRETVLDGEQAFALYLDRLGSSGFRVGGRSLAGCEIESCTPSFWASRSRGACRGWS